MKNNKNQRNIASVNGLWMQFGFTVPTVQYYNRKLLSDRGYLCDQLYKY